MTHSSAKNTLLTNAKFTLKVGVNVNLNGILRGLNKG